MHIDRDLISACKAQNRAAQKKLYLALLPYLRAVARRYLRDVSYEKDALQETFVKLFRSLEKYDPAKAPLKSWAARMTINTCLNYNERVIGLPAEEIENVPREGTEEVGTYTEKITDETMLDALRAMPAGYAEIFNLFVIDEYNHREIAEMLQISEAVSRQKLSRAKNWLRKSELLRLGAGVSVLVLLLLF